MFVQSQQVRMRQIAHFRLVHSTYVRQEVRIGFSASCRLLAVKLCYVLLPLGPRFVWVLYKTVLIQAYGSK